jgi:hypothetical protein
MLQCVLSASSSLGFLLSAFSIPAVDSPLLTFQVVADYFHCFSFPAIVLTSLLRLHDLFFIIFRFLSFPVLPLNLMQLD